MPRGLVPQEASRADGHQMALRAKNQFGRPSISPAGRDALVVVLAQRVRLKDDLAHQSSSSGLAVDLPRASATAVPAAGNM